MRRQALNSLRVVAWMSVIEGIGGLNFTAGGSSRWVLGRSGVGEHGVRGHFAKS